MAQATGQYAPINGLNMYYEIHGEGQPLMLLHGAMSAIGTSFGALLPDLAQSYQVIAVDLQGHGHTADVDRPLNIQAMADDVAGLIRHLKLKQVDLFGYSMGAGVALETAVRFPELVRKLAVASVTFNKGGFHPGLLEGLDQLQPEMLAGTPWQQEYASVAPHPENWPSLVNKVKHMNQNIPDWTAEQVQSIQAPTLLIIGDSDIMRPEHAVEMFRLLGGGVPGDNMGLPNSQLAILPGTTHAFLTSRADLLLPILHAFLDKPMSETK